MNDSQSHLRQLPEPPNATAVFVLGLLSLIMCAPLGIFAWVMGSSAQGAVRGRLDGQASPAMLLLPWLRTRG